LKLFINLNEQRVFELIKLMNNKRTTKTVKQWIICPHLFCNLQSRTYWW